MVCDPRTKMLIATCLSSLALLYNKPYELIMVLVATLATLVFFGFQPAAVWKSLKPFIFLMLFLFIVQSIFTPGNQALLRIGNVSLASLEGVRSGASVVLRIFVITAAAMILTTISTRDFILGMVQLKAPYELAFMVAIAFRFLPFFRDQLKDVLTAVQLRGVDLKKIPWGCKLNMYKRLVFPIVYRTMRQAEQMATAMEARGFRAYHRRTYLRRLQFTGIDYAVCCFFATATLLLIYRQLF